MDMKNFLIAVLGVVGLMLSACSSDDESGNTSPSPYREIELSPSTRAVADAGNDFAFRLFAQLSASDGEENVTCCPLSAFMTLAMVANGDDGDARDNVLDVLGFKTGKEGVDELNRYCRLMLSELPALDRSTDVRLANSVWLKDYMVFATPFSETLTDCYNAELREFNDNLQVVDVINDWIERKSEGLIESFLNDPVEDLVLANVTYFKGMWSVPFDKEMTDAGKFKNADGSSSQVEFMRRLDEEICVASDGIYGVRLPFGNGNYTMTLLRNESGSAPDITMSDWEALMESASEQLVRLQIPKFKSEYTKDILGDLEAMGLRDYNVYYNMSLNKADGSKTPNVIHGILHGTSVAVDEDGTEAAGVTVTQMSTGFGKWPEVNLNVPFVYVVSESSTGSVVFMGRVLDMKRKL